MRAIDNWEQVAPIFETAIELSGEERERYLLELLGTDPDLLNEVKALLEEDATSGDLLEQGASDLIVAVLAGPEEEDFSLANVTILSNRFEILRPIGRGAMGEVYACRDQETGRATAVKVIRPDIAASPGVLGRFRQELALARDITHHNVCKMFDLHSHSVAPGESLHYFTMELLQGETLRERLHRTGALPLEEARAITGQIVAGIAAAHRLGIAHRDLKSANIMLVPEDGKERVVVADFGVALDVSEPAARSGSVVVGTPLYMAPEQVDGSATMVSDIYAVGVLMYEMITGRPPFETSPLLQKLTQKPLSPRKLVPSLSRRWERAILRCLEIKPEHRFQRIEDILPAIEIRDRRRPLAAAMAGSALLLVAFWQVQHLRTQHAPTAQVDSARGHAFAVLGFRNLSRSTTTNYLTIAARLCLDAELSASPNVRSVSQESISQLDRDLSMQASGELTESQIVKAGAALHADYILTGSVLATEEQTSQPVLITLSANETKGGKRLVTFSEHGSSSEVADLISRLGTRLRASLHLRDSPAAELAARMALPSNRDAAQSYALGMEALARYEAHDAQNYLERSAALEPGFAPAHLALSRAWSYLGYDRRALASAERAFQLSSKLGGETELLATGRYWSLKKNPKLAAKAYGSLFAKAPANIEYGLLLLSVQDGPAADRTLNALRKISDDPRIDLAEAQHANSQSDYSRERRAALVAIEKATRNDMPVLAAWGRLSEAWSSRTMGKYSEAASAAEQAREQFAAAGDWTGVGRALRQEALVAQDRGDLELAESLYRKALLHLERTGARSHEASAINGLAIVANRRGEFAEATKLYLRALRVCSEVEDDVCAARAHNNLGFTSIKSGDIGAAERHYASALTLFRNAGAIYGLTIALNNMAEVRLEQGRLDDSEANAKEAIRLAAKIASPSEEANSLAILAETRNRQGRMQEAENLYRRAIEQHRRIGEQVETSIRSVSLARVQLQLHRASEALDSANTAAALLAQSHRDDDAAVANDVAALSALALGEIELAAAKIKAARRKVIRDYRARVITDAVYGAVLTAEGQNGQGEALTAAARRAATKAGFPALPALWSVHSQPGLLALRDR